MPSKLVRVELGDNGLPIRIFRTKDWRLLPAEKVQVMDRGAAVGLIRKQVFERARVEGPRSFGDWFECERCGRRISLGTGEMNEKRPKGKAGGKTGGEVSLENCEALCHQCHTGSPDSAHGNRRWQTAKLDPERS
jgi:5-methylcytosine-specific restriction endonuclease McrA